MTWIEEMRRWRDRRRERIRKAILGNTPRPSPLERFSLVFAIVALAYICYHFRLVHAQTFEVIAFGFVISYFAGRRIWWSRRMAREAQGKNTYAVSSSTQDPEHRPDPPLGSGDGGTPVGGR